MERCYLSPDVNPVDQFVRTKEFPRKQTPLVQEGVRRWTSRCAASTSLPYWTEVLPHTQRETEDYNAAHSPRGKSYTISRGEHGCGVTKQTTATDLSEMRDSCPPKAGTNLKVLFR